MPASGAACWRKPAAPARTPRSTASPIGVCCAYRRAIRDIHVLGGLRAVLFARRLGQPSALPAPPHWLPQPELLVPWRRLCQAMLAALLDGRAWHPPPGLPSLALLRDRITGRRPLPCWAEPA